MLIDQAMLCSANCSIIESGESTHPEAQIVTGHMAEAYLKGYSSHGVGMILWYYESLHSNNLHLNKSVCIVTDC